MNFLNSWSALDGKAKPLIRNRVLAGSGTWHFMCLMRHQVFLHLIGSILKEWHIDALKFYIISLFDINALLWHYSKNIMICQSRTYFKTFFLWIDSRSIRFLFPENTNKSRFWNKFSYQITSIMVKKAHAVEYTNVVYYTTLRLRYDNLEKFIILRSCNLRMVSRQSQMWKFRLDLTLLKQG